MTLPTQIFGIGSCRLFSFLTYHDAIGDYSSLSTWTYDANFVDVFNFHFGQIRMRFVCSLMVILIIWSRMFIPWLQFVSILYKHWPTSHTFDFFRIEQIVAVQYSKPTIESIFQFLTMCSGAQLAMTWNFVIDIIGIEFNVGYIRSAFLDQCMRKRVYLNNYPELWVLLLGQVL